MSDLPNKIALFFYLNKVYKNIESNFKSNAKLTLHQDIRIFCILAIILLSDAHLRY